MQSIWTIVINIQALKSSKFEGRALHPPEFLVLNCGSQVCVLLLTCGYGCDHFVLCVVSCIVVYFPVLVVLIYTLCTKSLEICVRVVILCAICRDSPVGIVTGYGLDGLGLIRDRARDFSVLHNVQTGPRAHSASYTMGTRGCFSGGKVAGA
jgi:hypothetical protein